MPLICSYYQSAHVEFLVVLSKEDELPRVQGVFAGYVARIDSNVARAGAEGEERRSEYSRQEEQRYQCSRVHVSAAVQECTALLQREVRFCSCKNGLGLIDR